MYVLSSRLKLFQARNVGKKVMLSWVVELVAPDVAARGVCLGKICNAAVVLCPVCLIKKGVENSIPFGCLPDAEAVKKDVIPQITPFGSLAGVKLQTVDRCLL